MKLKLYILGLFFLVFCLSCSAQQFSIDNYLGQWVNDGSIPNNRGVNIFTLTKEGEKAFINIFNNYKFELKIDPKTAKAFFNISGIGPGEDSYMLEFVDQNIKYYILINDSWVLKAVFKKSVK
jgi:hypothetical protein